MHHIEDLYLCEYCFAKLSGGEDVCPAAFKKIHMSQKQVYCRQERFWRENI